MKNKQIQSGMGLLEVLVALLIIVIGITSLVTIQLRVLNNINSAQTKTGLINSTKNFYNQIIINPKLGINDDSTYKDYSDYDFNGCENKKNTIMNKSILSRKDYINNTIEELCQEIRDIPSISLKDVKVKICMNEKIEENDYNNEIETTNSDAICNNQGQNKVVKILWKNKTNFYKTNINEYYFYNFIMNDI